MVIALPPTVPSALATVQLGLGTASMFSHSSELTATISQELVMGQALDEPVADVIPLIITKILEVGTIIASLYKWGNWGLEKCSNLSEEMLLAGGGQQASSRACEREDGAGWSSWKGHTGPVLQRHTLTHPPQANRFILIQDGAHLSYLTTS